MAPSLPEKIGRYRVERLLGSGSMGFVYLGRDPELGRRVAIKTIRDLRLDEEAHARFLQRFKNEAKVAAHLQHPNIVQIYDVGEDESVGPYLVFEYVSGSTLKALLERGPLPPPQIVRIAEEVAAALETAHHEGVIHRDIKPDNLFVSSAGVVKLGDFGIARIPNAEVTTEGQFLGTPCYAAPETLRDQAYGAQSDLFSLAAVIYEAITAKRAFGGEDAVQVARNILHKEPIPPSKANPEVSVPAQVDAVVLQGLAKQPAQRFSTAAAFAGALHSAYERAGSLPKDRSPLAAASAPKRSLLLFLSVLLIGAIFAFFAVSGPSAEPFSFPRTAPDAPSNAVGSLDQPSEDQPPPPTGLTDAGERAAKTIAGLSDMTPHEREEAAKDELERARAALKADDFAAARRALGMAAVYDPENPDITELLERLPPEQQ